MRYSESREETIEELEDLISDHKWKTLKLKGSLEELTTSPTLLTQLVESQKNMRYDAEKLQLVIKKTCPKEMVL